MAEPLSLEGVADQDHILNIGRDRSLITGKVSLDDAIRRVPDAILEFRNHDIGHSEKASERNIGGNGKRGRLEIGGQRAKVERPQCEIDRSRSSRLIPKMF